MSTHDSTLIAPAGSAAPLSPKQQELQDYLVGQVATMARLARKDIEIDRPFAYYGLDSAQILELTGRLAERLEINIPDSIAWEQPTIRRLAGYLSGNPVEEPPVPAEFMEE